MTDSRISIMLVEDNDDHAELIMRAFSEVGNNLSIIRFSDGEAALSYLFGDDPGNSVPLPHLILLDLRLPKVDGIEVLKKIKGNQNTRIIPVVILTSSDSDLDVVRAYSNYVNSYLVKPIDYNRFFSLMDQINNYWINSNRNSH
ncbi:MAG: response regulator [Syntrophothermus sp.]